MALWRVAVLCLVAGWTGAVSLSPFSTSTTGSNNTECVWRTVLHETPIAYKDIYDADARIIFTSPINDPTTSVYGLIRTDSQTEIVPVTYAGGTCTTVATDVVSIAYIVDAANVMSSNTLHAVVVTSKSNCVNIAVGGDIVAMAAASAKCAGVTRSHYVRDDRVNVVGGLEFFVIQSSDKALLGLVRETDTVRTVDRELTAPTVSQHACCSLGNKWKFWADPAADYLIATQCPKDNIHTTAAWIAGCTAWGSFVHNTTGAVHWVKFPTRAVAAAVGITANAGVLYDERAAQIAAPAIQLDSNNNAVVAFACGSLPAPALTQPVASICFFVHNRTANTIANPANLTMSLPHLWTAPYGGRTPIRSLALGPELAYIAIGGIFYSNGPSVQYYEIGPNFAFFDSEANDALFWMPAAAPNTLPLLAMRPTQDGTTMIALRPSSPFGQSSVAKIAGLPANAARLPISFMQQPYERVRGDCETIPFQGSDPTPIQLSFGPLSNATVCWLLVYNSTTRMAIQQQTLQHLALYPHHVPCLFTAPIMSKIFLNCSAQGDLIVAIPRFFINNVTKLLAVLNGTAPQNTTWLELHPTQGLALTLEKASRPPAPLPPSPTPAPSPGPPHPAPTLPPFIHIPSSPSFFQRLVDEPWKIAVIAVVGLAFVIIVVVLIVCCVRRKRDRIPDPQKYYALRTAEQNPQL